MNKQKGFTLIELMIVVALIAIISMFAVPSYQNAQRKARISEGIAQLTSAQSQIEKYRLQNRKPYAELTLAEMKIEENIKYSSKNIYQLTYVKAEESNIADKYTLTATAVGNWLNANDKCAKLELSGLGILEQKSDCQK